MENFSPAEIWAAILAVASAVVLVSNAAEKIVQAWKTAKAPNVRKDERLQALEDWKEKVDAKLQRDHDSNRVTQRALLALLDHGIDGNNIEQMLHAKEELQNHLINR